MQGLHLGPGEVFSFWKLVGNPNEKNGYRAASTLIQNKVNMAVGGGLCQLSGVIYNVALLAGCEILERHPHTIDAYGDGRYIPLGRDATVDYPFADLCFQNPHAFPLVLVLRIEPDQASGALYAPKPREWTVEIHVSPAEVIPSPIQFCVDVSLQEGKRRVQPGLDGKRVTAWRIIQSGDGEVRRERLSTDSYLATPTFIRIGGGSA
jgi:vancomycin resistance protein YoaR